MSKYVVDYQSLKSIANAVRNRYGSTELMLLSEMPSAIEAIPQSVPDGSVNISDITISADNRLNLGAITAPSNIGGISNVSA